MVPRGDTPERARGAALPFVHEAKVDNRQIGRAIVGMGINCQNRIKEETGIVSRGPDASSVHLAQTEAPKGGRSRWSPHDGGGTLWQLAWKRTSAISNGWYLILELRRSRSVF